jgi:tryptophan synthase alpha chain
VNETIGDAFEKARQENRVAFIPYLMAGDPDLETSEEILVALRDEGADLVELGVPYSDPLADGPTVAAAAQRALAGGTRLADVIRLAQQVRAAGAPPIVLFTYLNPVLQHGVERFANDLANAQLAGAIVPDGALEEIAELRGALRAHALEMPLLVAPSTTQQRAQRIAQAASGFIYVVSRLGVTGATSAPDLLRLREQIAALRACTAKPLAVGFGISRREHVQAVASFADGVVVGSAIIDAYAGKSGRRAADKVRTFVRGLRGMIP